jgi:hypothetical protein
VVAVRGADRSVRLGDRDVALEDGERVVIRPA